MSASQAKQVRSRDLLSKQLYINAWMCPKPKPQPIYNQKSSTFGASTFLTSQCCKSFKCCACYVKLLYLLLRPFEGAREQHAGALLEVVGVCWCGVSGYRPKGPYDLKVPASPFSSSRRPFSFFPRRRRGFVPAAPWGCG